LLLLLLLLLCLLSAREPYAAFIPGCEFLQLHLHCCSICLRLCVPAFLLVQQLRCMTRHSLNCCCAPACRFATYDGIDACGCRLADEVRGLVAAQPSLSRISVVAHSMGGLMARCARRRSQQAAGVLAAAAAAAGVSMCARQQQECIVADIMLVSYHHIAGCTIAGCQQPGCIADDTRHTLVLLCRYAIGQLYNPASRTICGLQPAHFVTLATPHCGCDADGVAQVRDRAGASTGCVSVVQCSAAATWFVAEREQA
jgi:hypothetical protein